ncbi:dynein regulatory complex protein 9-like isoform X1 [Trichoplusia ni]|uniref:Dynein regulatory complex protein 9-like isoform X1 n=2 Tax=Trichoplusia ni TaxID=7111 RepID=A0A7E5W1B3_TRINI|nr:dynein regulatory complex protein 9-like isoform X1 [Trichoplusia ni]
MERGRIASIVSDTWGRAAVYTYETPKAASTTEQPEILYTSNAYLRTTASSISQELAELHIPDPITLVPVEGMTTLLSYLYATLLEDVISQMWILERCNNELNIRKTLFDLDNFLAVKFDIKKPNHADEDLVDINPANLNSITYKIKKLDADRKYVNNVVQSTYLDLAQSFHFTPLVKYIREIETRNKYRAELEEEESKNRMLRKELSRQVRQQRNHFKTVLYDTDVNIDRLRTQVEDSVLLSEVRSRYIDNWQQARAEQNNQVISDIESIPGDKIANYKLRTGQENRVHAEVELLVNIAINETLAKVEEWMDKYDTDMENIDLKIQIKKNDYQNMRDKRFELEEMLAKHEMQMKAWIKFKEEREENRRYIELMTNSAIIVQAWWRGLIVRLQLGPFKVKKPKKGLKK